ncbi:MAG: GWxTD domain-containing protein [Bacteroidia bacterium]
MRSKLYIALIALLLICYSCNTTRPQGKGSNHNRERVQKRNYNKEDNNLLVDMFLYHTDSINSQLFYSINNSQLLYKRKDTATKFFARIKVFYKILPYADSKVFYDSSTVYINDSIERELQPKQLTGYIPLKTNATQTSYIELFIIDVNNKKHQTHYIKCEKINPYTQQNFILLGNGGRVYFSNKIEKGSSITVNNARVSYNNARVDFFANDYSLPPPPFSQREPLPYPSIPDSSFYIKSYDGHSITLPVAKQGIYFVRLDSAANTSGCTIMGVEQNFPKVLSHIQMIAATRFILSKDEFQKMMNAPDKQASIDKFWLDIAGNKDHAKELIKCYYNRVQDANTFFTSHLEGWKTDMGMIYIVFGSPTKTYKTKQMETWIYGHEGAPNAVTFRFEKINNPFSETNFKLIRNANYKDPWYIAVGNWREGRVYLDTK